MELIPQAKKAIDMLSAKGFSAYLVGGTVRNFLLDKEPSDIDITTNALPVDIKNIFAVYPVVETGLKHGTVTVVFDKIFVEITTYRIDGVYADNRRPVAVQFTTDLQADCTRRDFTINAICYNPTEGFVDFFGGTQDLQNKIIRCVGDANTRFAEDALRILRGLRFACVLGFEIEEKTKQAIFENANLLKNISAERISTEFLKLICGKNAKQIITEYISVIGVFIPELLPMVGFAQNNPHHIYDVLTHTAYVVQNMPSVAYLRLAALLHDVGKPQTYTLDQNRIGHFYLHSQKSSELANQILNRLKLDTKTKIKVQTLVKIHDLQIPLTHKAVKKQLAKYGVQTMQDLVILKRADYFAQNQNDFDRTSYLDCLQKILCDIIAQEDCFSLKQLAVNGSDLIAIGIQNGKQIGTMLNLILENVLEGTLENQKQSLLDFAKNKKL